MPCVISTAHGTDVQTLLGSATYEHFGEHKHPKPPHFLHILEVQSERFSQSVKPRLHTAPIAFQVGDAHNPSVMDVSPVFGNIERVRKEKRKIAQASGYPSNGNSLFDATTKFDVDYPNFLIGDCSIGVITVISFQTQFMRERLSEVLLVEGQVHGLVSDAAHKIFADRSKLLISSCTYDPLLRRWVPILLTWSNGGTSEHYSRHFLVLFQSLARQRHLEGRNVTDQDFTTVRTLSSLEHQLAKLSTTLVR